jgi:hypothetical protein
VDGDFGSAQEDYQEALKRNGKNVHARYNLSLVFAETFRTVEAAQTLQAARALDPREVQRFQETPNLVKVVSQDFTVADAREKIELLEPDSRNRRILGHFRTSQSRNGLVPIIPAIVLALVAAFFLDRYRESGRGYSTECQKCGRIFCRYCRAAGESDLLCSQCVHVYMRKDGVAIETKLQKLKEVKRRKFWEEKSRIVLNVFLPGSAAFFASHVGIAVASLSLFTLGLLAAFERDSLAVVARPSGSPALVMTIIWLAVALAGWILGQLSARRTV